MASNEPNLKQKDKKKEFKILYNASYNYPNNLKVAMK